MKDFFSPGSLVTIAGGVLTVVGATAYATGSANLSRGVPPWRFGTRLFLPESTFCHAVLLPHVGNRWSNRPAGILVVQVYV